MILPEYSESEETGMLKVPTVTGSVSFIAADISGVGNTCSGVCTDPPRRLSAAHRATLF